MLNYSSEIWKEKRGTSGSQVHCLPCFSVPPCKGLLFITFLLQCIAKKSWLILWLQTGVTYHMLFGLLFFLSFQTMKVGLALQASQGMVCWCLSVANFCILIALIPVLESWKSLSLGKARVKGSHNSYGEWINKPLLWLEGTEDSLHQPAITVHTEGHVQGVWKSSRMENP